LSQADSSANLSWLYQAGNLKNPTTDQNLVQEISLVSHNEFMTEERIFAAPGHHSVA